MLYDDKRWEPKLDVVDEVGQIMLKAADYLETHRWGQDDLVLKNGAVCLVGAMIKIETGKVHSDEAQTKCNKDHPLTEQAAERIQKYLTSKSDPIHAVNTAINWNDTYGRKKSEVIDILRKAATPT